MSVRAVADRFAAFYRAYTAVSAVNISAFVFSTFVFRKVTDFAAFTVVIAVAVRIFDNAVSVRGIAFLPVFTCYFSALVLDARFCFVSVFIDIAFVAFAFFLFAFENAASETAFKVAYFGLRFRNAVAVFVFFESVDAFAVFVSAAVDVAV